MQEILDRDQRFLMRTYGRIPLVLDHGAGTEVWDASGKRYLDMFQGIAVNNLGHCHPAVTAAVRDQVGRLVQVSNYFANPPMVDLAELLVTHSAFDRVFFANTGAEANEGAIKLARRVGTLRKDGAYEVISALNSFHGRTLATLAATGKPAYHAQYDPLPGGFVHVPWGDFDAIRAATTPRAAAILLEPVQGEGGVWTAPPAYFEAIRQWCDEQQIVLIFDEIQTGAGRTGTLWAYEQLGVVPDVMTVAKGLGGGLVIGAFLAKDDFCVFGPGDHGTTFGGNPLSTAAALATLRTILDEGILANAQERSQQFRAGVDALAGRHPVIAELRGMGLLLGIGLGQEIATPLADACRERGLLVNAVRPDTLRLLPPLTITAAEVAEVLGILDSALAAVTDPVSVSARPAGG